MYINSSNNCNTCIHEDVCKYKKFVQDIYINDDSGDIEKIIKINIHCKIYETRYETRVADRKE